MYLKSVSASIAQPVELDHVTPDEEMRGAAHPYKNIGPLRPVRKIYCEALRARMEKPLGRTSI